MEEELEAPFDPVDYTLAQRRATLGNAFASIDDDPEKGARAQNLGELTGTSPALVYGDLDNFEKQHKAGLAATILNNNQHLRKYLDEEPMAAKVSNDDYGQLDAVAQSLEKRGTDSIFGAAIKASAKVAEFYRGVVGAQVKGFTETADYGMWNKEISELSARLAEYPAMQNLFVRQGVVAGAAGFVGTLATLTGVVSGAAAGVGEGAKQLGMPEAEANRLVRDLIIAANTSMPELARIPEITAAANAYKTLKPYIDAGVEPPVGVHPIADQMKAEQAKTDADNLGEALKEAAKSSTRERSPELFTKYIRSITDGEIGINADAVRALYGDKVPLPDDGLLGFVPDLAAQLARAETTGGDITVNLAEWLGKVEPEVAKELKDFIRARPEGVTLEEAKVLPKGEEAITAEPVEATRQTAALGVQERKLTLERVEDSGMRDGKEPTHGFILKDAAGADQGVIYLAEENGGKRLYVDDIQSALGPQSLGPKAMRDVLQQIKEAFPNAETLEGMRVSGAREKAGIENSKDLKASIDLTKIKPRAKAPEPEKPGLVQQMKDAVLGKTEEAKAAEAKAAEERALFDKASSIGMTVEQYKRYQKLIEKQQAEDVAYYTKRADAEAKKRLSKEWKEAETELRPQVADEVNSRPDIAADNYLRSGTLFGEPTKIVRLGDDYLTPEQRRALPKEFVEKDGAHPDDIASLVGYPTGSELIAGLIKLQTERTASGMNATNYRRRLIGAELERQVTDRMSKRADEVLAEAKDHVLSETQQQLLHEQTIRLAEEAGAEMPITKADLAAGIKEVMDNSRFMDKAISSDAFLADAGRAGRAMEMALLKGDAAEAFRQSQRQTHAFAFAREALKLEGEKAKFEKLAKKYSGREVKRVEPAATNYIQMLLSNAGVKMRLSPAEIATGIAHEGYASFPDYVVDKQQMGWEPQIADFVAAGGKSLDKMTVAEFREFKDAIDSLDHIGRAEAKIDLLGEQMDWKDFQSKVISNLEQKPMRPREGQDKWLYKIDASLTRMEEMVKDFDLREQLGPIYSAVIEPMMASKAKSFDLMTDLSHHFKKTRGDFGRKWRRSLEDTIPQDFMIDSYTRAPLDMTRENLINVMLNWGNRSNIEKVTRGYASLEVGRIATKEEAAAFEVKLKQLIDTHARPEDWAFVSRMWEPFKTWQPMIDTLSRNVSGSAPKWIEAVAIDTPAGKVEGGYWPVKYDRLGSDLNVVEDRKANANGLFGPNYIRATTAKGHLKERTGYVDFVDLHNSIEQAAGVMQQTIQDIAFRDSLIQASKVFYDKPIRAAIRKHYGAEYEAQLIPWLKDIANQYVTDDKAIQGVNGWLRRVRINLVGHALPLNLKVIFSPDIGVPNPKQWASFEANRAENVKFAMEHSNEIRHLVYNMDRDFREQLERAVKNGTWDSFQSKAVEWGFKPVMKVSQEFRMSTFIDQYKKAKADGRSDHEASVIADSFVRERHGAASVVDLPAVMRSNEAMKQLTMFYGYFNTMYNWQRQLPGNVRRGEWKNFMVNGLGAVGVGAAFGALLFNQAKEGDSWWKTMGKALMMQPLGTIPVIRDAAGYMVEGFGSRTPTAALITAVGSAVNAGKNLAQGKPVKNPIRTAANVIGPATGLPMAQVGRSAQFLHDVQTGKQRPRNILEYMRGLIHGEARLKP